MLCICSKLFSCLGVSRRFVPGNTHVPGFFVNMPLLYVVICLSISGSHGPIGRAGGWPPQGCGAVAASRDTSDLEFSQLRRRAWGSCRFAQIHLQTSDSEFREKPQAHIRHATVRHLGVTEPLSFACASCLKMELLSFSFRG